MSGFQVGRIFGIPLYVDGTALLVLGLVALASARGPGGVAAGFVLALLVFGSVLVHELGHALAARRYQLDVAGIVLQGFGGLTIHERAPTAMKSFFVTLAGPLAGFLLGAVAVVPWLVLGEGLAGDLAGRLVAINLFWSAFNLLPMYPLDGGYLVVHGLSTTIHPAVAQLWAARLGVVVALGVGAAAGLGGQIFIAAVAAMSLFHSFPLAFGGRR